MSNELKTEKIYPKILKMYDDLMYKNPK